MKIQETKIQLVHNPTAGAEEHEAEHLMELLQAAGYKGNYSSSKKKILKKVAADVKYIAVAGGDGTVRKTILAMLDKKLKYKRPVAILPLGTANNIASSLAIEENLRLNADTWRNEKFQKLDIGVAKTRKDEEHFIESFGFGLFPALIKWMDEQPRTPAEEPDDEVKQAHNALLHLANHYEPIRASMVYDGKEVSNEFLMIELLNISRLGPKLQLAKADPGDGLLELIAVKASQRPILIKYFEEIVAGNKPVFPIKSAKVNQIKISVDTKDIHVDDELKEVKSPNWNISVLPNMMDVILTK
ncbi:diacylglycerol/lipid kinase family protein [Pedobacter sp. SL55]|uniref:diacylglycerol/lipid kinase family protein n=1 Tax=Pedobacter sp. SL55 TaxID=2995161 RepID=UPI00226EC0D6|nr:diacylglycerol kinase family protein [Pedobacter sp. SL55]WAC39929.1 diacylglycerol kinase family protein [Pedobacter sp. SL55]